MAASNVIESAVAVAVTTLVLVVSTQAITGLLFRTSEPVLHVLEVAMFLCGAGTRVVVQEWGDGRTEGAQDARGCLLAYPMLMLGILAAGAAGVALGSSGHPLPRPPWNDGAFLPDDVTKAWGFHFAAAILVAFAAAGTPLMIMRSAFHREDTGGASLIDTLPLAAGVFSCLGRVSGWVGFPATDGCGLFLSKLALSIVVGAFLSFGSERGSSRGGRNGFAATTRPHRDPVLLLVCLVNLVGAAQLLSLSG